MATNVYLVKLALKNRIVNNDLTKIIRATEGLEIMHPKDNRKPDLLILELGKEPDKEIAMIQSLIFFTNQLPKGIQYRWQVRILRTLAQPSVVCA